jgi:hypothetical protein
MASARRRGAGHSGEVCRDMVRGRDGAGGRRQCQEGMVDEPGRGVALCIHRSGRNAGPRGERLGRVWSAVWSGYGAGEGTWGSGSLGQGSEEHVTSWSVTICKVREGRARVPVRACARLKLCGV